MNPGWRSHSTLRMTLTRRMLSLRLGSAIPAGYVVGPPPSEVQLEFRSERAMELVDKLILFNWQGVGWCQGRIVSPNC